MEGLYLGVVIVVTLVVVLGLAALISVLEEIWSNYKKRGTDL